jgi:hypothetical protein
LLPKVSVVSRTINPVGALTRDESSSPAAGIVFAAVLSREQARAPQSRQWGSYPTKQREQM